MDYTNSAILHQQLQLGNTKAFDFLVDTYYSKLCAYARSLSKDKIGAEDIVQNVMATIWVNRKKIDFKVSVKSYLYKSVYNEFLNQFRSKSKIIYLEKKYIEALESVVENESLDIDRLMRVVNIEIEKLPNKCKQVFLLNKKEGLTHIEISEHLGISVKTIEAHMTRAFKILDAKLGEKVRAILFLLFDLCKASRLHY